MTLQDKFPPRDPQGQPAANRPTQGFEGGKQLQRTGLVIVDNTIFAGFGGHCDNFNYTWVSRDLVNVGVGLTCFRAQRMDHWHRCHHGAGCQHI